VNSYTAMQYSAWRIGLNVKNKRNAMNVQVLLCNNKGMYLWVILLCLVNCLSLLSRAESGDVVNCVSTTVGTYSFIYVEYFESDWA